MKLGKNIVPALLAALFVTSSCDFVRAVAGRPTSASLEAMKQEKERRAQAEHQARLDSMRRVRQQMADSMAARQAFLLDSLVHSSGAVMASSRLGGIQNSAPGAKYCIVIGAFRSMDNAGRKLKAVIDAGYDASIVCFNNGLNAVTLCPSNDISVIADNLKSLRTAGVCPKEGWVLISDE